ncbi:MAG: glycosyltransferase [Candidatus Korobacteraceae bacterium]
MSSRIRFCFFAHSWISDWSHEDAHFLRGLVSELQKLGHDVRCYEELGSWSLTNLVKEEGDVAAQAIEQFRREFPELDVRFYQNDSNLREALKLELADSDVVVIHDRNHPEVANAVLSLKTEVGFRCLFHDTHQRALSCANELLFFHLQFFDGVLAFAEPIRRVYHDAFGVSRVWTFHPAADIRHFHPRDALRDIDLLWVDNRWDAERTSEWVEYLLRPIAELRNCRTVVHGVRYSGQERQSLSEAGIEFRGYLPNLMTPDVYARSALSLHMPGRPNSQDAGHLPPVQMFEALACGSAVLCSPWQDSEQLFRAGQDYLCVNSGAEMKTKIRRLLRDESARRQIGANGRETILREHTCAHRAAQLVDICEGLS